MENSERNRNIVLYVDDIEANLMLFEASFQDYFEVKLADSGKQALEILEKEEIHVLVSDQNMPGMTGNELLKIVTEKYPDIMRFMITAYTDYDTVVDAINEGNLYGYFNKPYKVDEVKHAIEKSLEVRTLRLRNTEMIEKLERANEMLVNLNRSKIYLLSSVTDEIRSPINKIMTAIHLIKDKIDSNELSELLNILDVAIGRLENFSDSAKQLVRLSDAGFEPEKKPVSLRDLLEVTIIEKGNLLNSEQISVEMGETISDQEVEGEYDLLLLTLTSLIDFMVGHITGISKISLGIENSSEGITVEIMSDGNFSAEDEKELQKLSDSEPTEPSDEFSLEIVLAREIMRMHGGLVQYREEKQGNVFIIQFSES